MGNEVETITYMMLHKNCVSDPTLVWMMCVSYIVIAIVCLSAPVLFLRFLHRHKAKMNFAVVSICSFTALCGLANIMDLWTMLVRPDYIIQALVLLLFAVFSVIFLFLLPGVFRYLEGIQNADEYLKDNHSLRDQLEGIKKQSELQMVEIQKVKKTGLSEEKLAQEDREELKVRADNTSRSLLEALTELDRMIGKLENITGTK